ncbi:MAG: hypothetical protein RL368_2333 [Pseudomonadota bacterium]|jgi:hypothetical protein
MPEKLDGLRAHFCLVPTLERTKKWEQDNILIFKVPFRGFRGLFDL